MIIPNPNIRAYVYSIILTLIPIAQFLRFIPGDAVQLVVNVVTAVLGSSGAALALPNTPHVDDSAKR